ncbi:hypothetical protein D029_4739A, partial [Vibrio parahaemolyticus 970107]
MKVSLP